MAAPNIAAKVCRGTLSQPAHVPYSRVSSTRHLTHVEYHRANSVPQVRRFGTEGEAAVFLQDLWFHRVEGVEIGNAVIDGELVVVRPAHRWSGPYVPPAGRC